MPVPIITQQFHWMLVVVRDGSGLIIVPIVPQRQLRGASPVRVSQREAAHTEDEQREVISIHPASMNG